MTAVLLRILGISCQAVEADYLSSRTWVGYERQREDLARLLEPNTAGQELQAALDAVFDARSTYLQAAFAAINEQFGSFGNYVWHAIGLANSQEKEMQHTLLE